MCCCIRKFGKFNKNSNIEKYGHMGNNKRKFVTIFCNNKFYASVYFMHAENENIKSLCC